MRLTGPAAGVLPTGSDRLHRRLAAVLGFRVVTRVRRCRCLAGGPEG